MGSDLCVLQITLAGRLKTNQRGAGTDLGDYCRSLGKMEVVCARVVIETKRNEFKGNLGSRVSRAS